MIKLSPDQYDLARHPLKTVAINTLFAQSIVEGKMPGDIYADRTENPAVFFIKHSYGMSLLFGNTDNEAFNKALYAYLVNENKDRDSYEWLQVYPNQWNAKLEELLEGRLIKKCRQSGNGGAVASGAQEQASRADVETGKVLENERVNFIFRADKYRQAVALRGRQECEIVRTTQEMAMAMSGKVVPKVFWRSDGKTLDVGIGYSLLCEGGIASTAFAAFLTETELEIGIETMEAYRGRGFAFSVCAALIEYCLDHGLEPVWACRRENEGSYNLAQSLGFEPTLTIPYYRLVV